MKSSLAEVAKATAEATLAAAAARRALNEYDEYLRNRVKQAEENAK